MCPPRRLFFFFFFNDTATTEIYTLSLHDALPICVGATFCARRGKEAEPLQGLHHERQRIAPTPDFAAVTAGHTQERAQRLQASAPVAQAQIQMVHVSPEPAAANAHAVVSAFGHTLPRRAADEQRREVDPGVDGQLQRPPESPVHLHDHLPARLRLAFTLDHGAALPVECVEQAQSGAGQALVERDALPVDAHPTGGGVLAPAAVGARGGWPPPPAPGKKNLTAAADPPPP